MWPFKKKKEKEEKAPELPELPELPKLSELPETKEFAPSPKPLKLPKSTLPSFPPSPAGEKISREAVKHAVTPSPPTPKPEPVERRTRELPKKARVPELSVREVSPKIKVEPVFVRIDRFQDSMAKFQDVKRKVLEIENLLRDIKELKAKEDAELHEWENEIQDAKSKLDKIDQTLFKKLD